MSPKTKKIKTDHVTEETVVQSPVEEKEPDWYLLEDLEAEDIDDEFGDMIIQQRLLVNNEVHTHTHHYSLARITFINSKKNTFIGCIRTYY